MVCFLRFLSTFCEIGILSANLCNTYIIYCSYLCSRNESTSRVHSTWWKTSNCLPWSRSTL